MTMKHKLLLSLMIAILVPATVLGESKNAYTISFRQGDFSYEKDDGIIHIISKRGDAILWGDTLSPALPGVMVNVLIAPDEEYAGVSYNADENLVMDDVTIAANPVPVPTNIHQTSSRTRRVDYSRAEYPETCVEYTGTHLTDGYKYLSFIVSPFRYDAANKRLYQKTSLTLQVQTTKETGLSRSNYIGRGENMRSAVKSLTINGDRLEELYADYIGNRALNSGSPSYKYVIITNATLKPVFEKLALWKTIKGVRTKVVTVEECYTQYSSDTHQLAIKKVLADYYTNGMEYALLAGDVEIVPAQMCYLPKYHDTVDTPSDLYYACLDGNITWNANGNLIYGEIGDNPDLDPEFIVTRASVSTLADASVFVDRIVEYESDPKLDGWTNSMLSCGHFTEIHDTINGAPRSEAQWQGEYVYEHGVQYPLWNGTFFELFDTYTDYPNGAAYAVNPDHLQTELEKGYTFVDEFSHGGIWGWGELEGSTVYSVDHAAALENNGSTVVTTIACLTNAFDKTSNNHPVCLSESFMRNPDGGILAYFGNSREGWQDYSYFFDEKFYETVHSGEDKQFGRAAMMAKIALLGSVSNSYFNAYRKIEMSLNALGDPEMPVFTRTPQYFQNVSVSFQNGSLSVSTGVDSCRICVSSVADSAASYYQIVDIANTACFSGVTNDCYLCITKPGYIPYIARVGSSVYLQNETIVKDFLVFSDNTYAGSDVTTMKAQGPVVIESGKVINRSNNEAFIKNDFEVKLGAELEINPTP